MGYIYIAQLCTKNNQKNIYITKTHIPISNQFRFLQSLLDLHLQNILNGILFMRHERVLSLAHLMQLHGSGKSSGIEG